MMLAECSKNTCVVLLFNLIIHKIARNVKFPDVRVFKRRKKFTNIFASLAYIFSSVVYPTVLIRYNHE